MDKQVLSVRLVRLQYMQQPAPLRFLDHSRTVSGHLSAASASSSFKDDQAYLTTATGISFQRVV